MEKKELNKIIFWYVAAVTKSFEALFGKRFPSFFGVLCGTRHLDGFHEHRQVLCTFLYATD